MDVFPDHIETDRTLCFPFCSQLCSCKWKEKIDGPCWLMSNCLSGSTVHPLCPTLQAGLPGRMTPEDRGTSAPLPFSYQMVQPPGGIRGDLKGRRRQRLEYFFPTTRPLATIMFPHLWLTSLFMTTFLLGFDNTSTSPHTFRPQGGTASCCWQSQEL